MEKETPLLVLVTLTLVILFTRPYTVSGQSITITGTSTLVTPTSELRITCQPSSAGISDVSTIGVQKNTSSTDYTSIVSVGYSKDSSSSIISWSNTAFQNRQGVSATGNVDTLGGARLVLTITANNTRCEDGGAYRCNMGVILTGGGGATANADNYVTATVLPTYTNALYVTPTPNVNGQYYSVGTTLTFGCSGTVGSDKKIHTWCYKQAGINTGFTGFPNAANINQNENGLAQDGCNYKRSSTLTYNVTAADTETTFMCEPFTGSMCGSSAAGLKANYTVRNFSGQSISILGTARFSVPMSEIRITCQPSSSGVSLIHSIDLFRNSSTVPYTKIVSIDYAGNSASVITWDDTDLRDRVGVSVTGTVNSPTDAQLVFVITRGNTRCEDAGVYRCGIRATLTGGGSGKSEVDTNVSVYVAPTYTNALSLITSGGWYPNNVKFICSGTVGSDRVSHLWCYRRAMDTDFIAYPYESDIRQHEVDLVGEGCNYIRTSSLTYTVRSEDRSTSFMCEPDTGRGCGQSRDGLKASFTLTNDAPPMTTVSDTNAAPIQCKCNVVPWIVVAVVSIVINVIAVIVIPFIRRLRSRG
ncbi:uncharacterized protein LOC110463742 [Mizuhopecten yessoensis]|uniref:uncharacterized protein LOC110463742 n=1 Tax=Mizuhopecten yessoensis TaxID=6573 RepID=UPI000B45E918|nr:uncharacterized protein LOC110463742 [Mizuhopecten yessoensis]